jgi:hypothetical protein
VKDAVRISLLFAPALIDPAAHCRKFYVFQAR